MNRAAFAATVAAHPGLSTAEGAITVAELLAAGGGILLALGVLAVGVLDFSSSTGSGASPTAGEPDPRRSFSPPPPAADP